MPGVPGVKGHRGFAGSDGAKGKKNQRFMFSDFFNFDVLKPTGEVGAPGNSTKVLKMVHE